jgi:hypothetical protein
MRSVMVMLGPTHTTPPWERDVPAVPGEEDGARVARALSRLWSDERRTIRAVAGVDVTQSPKRWSAAPPAAAALLLVPAEVGSSPSSPDRAVLTAGFSAGTVVDALPAKVGPPLVVVVADEPPALFAARLRALAGSPAMKGKLLAAFSLAGPVRPDLPASLLAEGNLAAIGLAEGDLVDLRHAGEVLGRFAASFGDVRPEQLDGPFLWYY